MLRARQIRRGRGRRICGAAKKGRGGCAAEKRMGGWEHFPLGKKRLRPLGAKKSPGRFAAKKFCAPGANKKSALPGAFPFSERKRLVFCLFPEIFADLGHALALVDMEGTAAVAVAAGDAVRSRFVQG